MRKANRQAFTVIELLIVVVILGIVTVALYGFFNHYSRTYLRVDERMEHVVQAWQVMRFLGDDLQNADFPATGPTGWRDILQSQSDGWNLLTRDYESIHPIRYRFSPATGDLTREQDGTVKPLLRGNCKEFDVQMLVTQAPPATMPVRIEFSIKLVLKNPRQSHEAHQPLSLETIIVPEFLNRKLRCRYVHQGLP